jgi:hypothetical protein
MICIYEKCHELVSVMPQLKESFTSRVSKRAPRDAVIAATCPSICEIG